jgi:hypothetical protein
MNKKDIKDIPSDLIQQALVLFALKPLALADLPQSNSSQHSKSQSKGKNLYNVAKFHQRNKRFYLSIRFLCACNNFFSKPPKITVNQDKSIIIYSKY